jgi:hypothetical protein
MPARCAARLTAATLPCGHRRGRAAAARRSSARPLCHKRCWCALPRCPPPPPPAPSPALRSSPPQPVPHAVPLESTAQLMAQERRGMVGFPLVCTHVCPTTFASKRTARHVHCTLQSVPSFMHSANRFAAAVRACAGDSAVATQKELMAARMHALQHAFAGAAPKTTTKQKSAARQEESGAQAGRAVQETGAACSAPGAKRAATPVLGSPGSPAAKQRPGEQRGNTGPPPSGRSLFGGSDSAPA